MPERPAPTRLAHREPRPPIDHSSSPIIAKSTLAPGPAPCYFTRAGCATNSFDHNEPYRGKGGGFNTLYQATGTLTTKPAWVWAPLIIQTAVLAVFSLGRLNRRIFHWFNGLSRLTGRRLWSKITIFGDSLVAFVLVFPLINLRPDIVWAFAWATLCTSIVVHVLKRGIKARRPPAVLARGEYILIGPRHNLHAYPSGHSATVFSLAGVLVLSIPFSLPRLLLILAAVLTACSRMVVGVHWPLDVLAGALIGWSAAWAGFALAALTPWAFSPLSP
ncbi:MAG: phosphatase PAP2 family protein [Candidatus Coatesbacteria bacterium]|nr:phosphatase PAP2 family protein [Candidatus Coatesbacteria bacterium]